ncbi:O-antigen translocase [Arcobacter porcinus]|uniref:Putative polysaccharide biosynthesis protein n=1 Tax=Arcobacter porcinus TaxID=1935204 RepID=A0A5C2HHF8_9BACT|nr:O-antigen translocase [Arcobacter porcinus]OCL92391.1 Polysaccharide biosynthesis protein [Aliarcobacter thereius]QEP40522.1 putative polysaccharide biosynthesis protein [Arcobacter porcinus]
MTLLKISYLSAISTIIKIAVGFITNKVIAVYLGPSGLAIVGQLINFMSLILNISGNAFTTATTKYVSEYKDNENYLKTFISTLFKITITSSIIVTVVINIFSEQLAISVFGSKDFEYIIKIFSISIPIFLINSFALAILNAYRKLKIYIIINILTSLFSMLFIVLLTIKYNIEGTLLSYIVVQYAILLLTFLVIKKEVWFKLANIKDKFDIEVAKKIGKFSLITLTSVSASSITLLIVRDYLSGKYSIDSAGHWQGIWSLSQVSLSIIATALSIYLLPTLSAQNDKSIILKELKKAYILMIPFAIFISIFMIIFKEYITIILFSKDFAPMNELYLWQFIGNVFKVGAWIIGYYIAAKAMVKTAIFTEFFVGFTFIGSLMFLTDNFGLVGSSLAYALSSLLHFMLMIFVFINNFKGEINANK